MTDPLGRVFSVEIALVMVAAGLAYSRLLWSLNLRPSMTLVVVGIAPGAIYLATVWAIRAIQGTPSLIYVGLLLDWLIFASTGVAAVLIARRHHA